MNLFYYPYTTNKQVITMVTQVSVTKKLLLASIAAAALAVSACADPESATTQDDVDAAADPQTAIEQEATGVDDVEQVEEDVNSAVVDDSLAVDPALAENDPTVVTTEEIADSEILDGTETEEHVSTY